VNFRYSAFFLFPGVDDGTVGAPSLEQGMFLLLLQLIQPGLPLFII
jgi:hypothetical protein